MEDAIRIKAIVCPLFIGLVAGCAGSSRPAASPSGTRNSASSVPAPALVAKVPTAKQLQAGLARSADVPNGYKSDVPEPNVLLAGLAQKKDCGARFQVLTAGSQTQPRADVFFSDPSYAQLTETLVVYDDGSARRTFAQVMATFSQCATFTVGSSSGGPEQTFRVTALPTPEVGDAAIAYVVTGAAGSGPKISSYITYVRVGNVVGRFGAVGQANPRQVLTHFTAVAVARLVKIA